MGLELLLEVTTDGRCSTQGGAPGGTHGAWGCVVQWLRAWIAWDFVPALPRDN